MRNGFTTAPRSDDMITEDMSETATALLCAACGWEGTAVLPNAPWPVFRTHTCRLSPADAGPDFGRFDVHHPRLKQQRRPRPLQP